MLFSFLFLLDLVIESVHLSNLPRFVVPTEERDAFRITSLVAQKEFQGLNAMVSSVNEVANKHVSRGGNFASLLEQLEQIEELSVHVSANLITPKKVV